jgi:hypothetical protein
VCLAPQVGIIAFTAHKVLELIAIETAVRITVELITGKKINLPFVLSGLIGYAGAGPAMGIAGGIGAFAGIGFAYFSQNPSKLSEMINEA